MTSSFQWFNGLLVAKEGDSGLKNWFNGLKMPSIVVKQLDGTVEVVREFGFNDYMSSLS